MMFWDSSAVIPLLVAEAATETLVRTLADDPVMAIWWATPTECVSALARREREGSLSRSSVQDALKRLRDLQDNVYEVVPSEAVRALAARMLRSYPLRAADALQLAAGTAISENAPATLRFVTLDDRLADAAHREMLEVIP